MLAHGGGRRRRGAGNGGVICRYDGGGGRVEGRREGDMNAGGRGFDQVSAGRGLGKVRVFLLVVAVFEVSRVWKGYGGGGGMVRGLD